jgi:hypothetical protein
MTLPVASSIKEAEAPDLFNTTSVPARAPDTKDVDKTTATPNTTQKKRTLDRMLVVSFPKLNSVPGTELTKYSKFTAFRRNRQAQPGLHFFLFFIT